MISSYIALRFEWKYAVPVLIALIHDILITAGVYALFGWEVTTATVAALLTILGYSLYDTIIVFDRMRENVPRMPRAAFSQIVNRSMSEVLTRSLATVVLDAAADPRAALLRRRDAEGLRLRARGRRRLRRLLVDLHRHPGAHALEGGRARLAQAPRARRAGERRRRPRVRHGGRRRLDRGRAGGAQARRAGGSPRRRTRTAPSRRDEFQEMVADLGLEEEQPTTATATAEPDEPRPGSGADLTPEDLVLKDDPKTPKPKRPRNRRHGR